MTFTTFYLRVSKDEGVVENQALELQAAGYEADATFSDEGVSGAVEAADRPGFAAMLDMLSRISEKRHRRLVVSKIDRLGRSARDVLATVERLGDMGVQVIVLQFGSMDLTSAAGKAFMTVAAAFAELERGLIRERVFAGLQRARKQGKKLGRPHALTPAQQSEARQALAEGASIAGLAKRYGCARGTIRWLRNCGRICLTSGENDFKFPPKSNAVPRALAKNEF